MRQLMLIPICALVLGVNARLKMGENLRELGESALRRLIHPIIIDPDKQVLDGTRRVMGMRMVLGDASDRVIECLMADEKLSPEQIIEINLLTALHRKSLTGFEQWQAFAKMLEAHPGWQLKDLASAVNLSPGTCTRILSPAKCLPGWQDALKAERVTIADCYRASQVSEVEQSILLAKKLGTANGAGGSPNEKGPKSRVPFEGGELTVSGMSMKALILALEMLLKEARKSADTHSLKTFASMQRDKLAQAKSPPADKRAPRVGIKE